MNIIDRYCEELAKIAEQKEEITYSLSHINISFDEIATTRAYLTTESIAQIGPLTGDLRLDTNSLSIMFYDGSAWLPLPPEAMPRSQS